MNEVIKTQQSKIVEYAKTDIIKKRFNQIFNDMSKTNGFITSLINIINNNKMLQNCDPETVFGSALVACSLNLPINPTIGFAYLLPYGSRCQLILGYKAYIQLAIRTGQYADIHCSSVYEDELDYYNPITGKVKFTDRSTWKQRDNNESNKIVGYYSYFKLLNCYSKEFYMSKKQIEAHAKKYSKSYGSTSSTNIWKSDFELMALKTVIRQLLRRWGMLSIEMQKAIEHDNSSVDLDDNISYDDNPNVKPKKDEINVTEIANLISGGVDDSGVK